MEETHIQNTGQRKYYQMRVISIPTFICVSILWVEIASQSGILKGAQIPTL